MKSSWFDNSQDSGAREEVERTCGPNVKWLTNLTNMGFAAANNQAIQLAQGDLLLLLDHDALVLPQTIDRMAEAMEAQPQVGILGCRLLNRDGTLQTSAYSLLSITHKRSSDATGSHTYRACSLGVSRDNVHEFAPSLG